MRYWKGILLAIVVMIGIFIYYIQVSSNDIKIEFETVSGNEHELDNMLMEINCETENTIKNLLVTNKKTIDSSEESTTLDGKHEPDIATLVDEYQSFMEGKELDTFHFYSDENQVIYVNTDVTDFRELDNPDKFVLEVEVLDKNTNDVDTFSLDMSNEENYDFIKMNDVQVVGNELKVFSIGSWIEYGNDVHVYTIDLGEKKLVSDKIIKQTITNELVDTDVFIEDDSIQPQKYIVMNVFTSSYTVLTDEQKEEYYSHDGYVVYDILNDKLTEINIPTGEGAAYFDIGEQRMKDMQVPTNVVSSYAYYKEDSVVEDTLYIVQFPQSSNIYRYDLLNNE